MTTVINRRNNPPIALSGLGTVVTIPFDSDMTLRWACRAGDYVFWARFRGLFSSSATYKIADIWELRDGNFLTITNRYLDLPDWFDLHPREVAGPLVLWMKKRLDGGYRPKEPIEGPNIWRVFAGDRVVWVGRKRSAVEFDNGVLGLVDFRENALVYGEPLDLTGAFPTFGGFDQGEPSPQGTRLCRVGWDALNRLGHSPVVAADDQWTMG